MYSIGLARRHIVTLMLYLGFFLMYCLRVNLSVTIVAMTTGKPLEDGSTNTTSEPEFDWNSEERGYVLSSFFYGYAVTQIPGGLLNRKISGHILFGLGIALSALLTLLVPPAAKLGLMYLIVLRVLAGLFEGIVMPSFPAIISNWAPPVERSRMSGFALAGASSGTIFAMALSGFIADNINWESVFYVFGTITLVWYAFWLGFIRESPEKDPFISKEEREYIMKSVKRQENLSTKIPWKNIFTSPAVWALYIAFVCGNWAYLIYLVQIPSYINDIFNFKVSNTGFLSAVPYIVYTTCFPISGALADWILLKGYLSRNKLRKYFISGALYLRFFFFFLIPFLTSPAASITVLTAGLSVGAFGFSMLFVNAIDLAPQFASIIMGVQSTLGNMPGFISPMLTGYIVQNGTIEEWRIVFFVTGLTCLLGGIFYWWFGSTELQSWAQKPENSKQSETPKEVVKLPEIIESTKL